MNTSSLSSAALAGALTFALVAACSSEAANDATLAALAAGCVVNSDCETGLVCAFRSCHEPCTTVRDCPENALCVLGTAPNHVCQLPAESACRTSADCVSEEICAKDARCRDQCASARDCSAGQSCVSGACADTTTLADGPDGASAIGSACAYTSDCASPFICTHGSCAYACLADVDCARGESCVGHVCGARASDAGAPDDATVAGARGTACRYTSECVAPLVCQDATCAYQCNADRDCDAPLGCVGHLCIANGRSAGDTGAASSDSGDGGDAGPACGEDADCQNGVFCDGFERCVGGHCRAASTAACSDGNPCTTDSCDESGQSCGHVFAGLVDADGDGHSAIACGNGADDCDDGNANVYPGHAETCDFLDNDCNGVIDEGLWKANTAASVAGLNVASGVTPAIVRYADQTYGATFATNASPYLAMAHLTASFALLGSEVAVPSPNASYSVSSPPKAATDGTSIATLAFEGVPSAFSLEAAVAPAALAPIVATPIYETNGVCGGPALSYGTASAVQWIPSQNSFLVAWGDSHQSDATTTYGDVFVANLSSGGKLSALRLAGGDEPRARASLGGGSLPTLGVSLSAGPSNVLVAWTSYPGVQARYGLMDSAGSSWVAGPFDTSDSAEQQVVGAVHVGSSYIVATRTVGTTSLPAKLLRIDDTSGALLSSIVYPGTATTVAANLDIELAVVGPGVGATSAVNGTLTWAWVPETLTGGTFQNPISANGFGTISSAAIVPLDGAHATLAWTSTSSPLLQWTQMACGS